MFKSGANGDFLFSLIEASFEPARFRIQQTEKQGGEPVFDVQIIDGCHRVDRDLGQRSLSLAADSSLTSTP